MHSRTQLLKLVIYALAIFIGVGVGVAQQLDADGADVVYVIAIHGTIDEGLAAYTVRAVDGAVEAGADAILLDINTFGGRVDSATDIRDALLRVDIPVIAFIPDRAWSAGALIALAADKIAMAPAASMGAAQPQPNDPKTVSALRAEFEAMAERNDRDPQVAAAMVDEAVEVEGLSLSGQILTLSAARADEFGYVEFISSNRAEVLSHFGFAGAEVEEVEPNWAENVARFLSDPTVSSILMMIGFLGLLAEITTPGWGLPGTAGIASLSLFFGARLVTGLAGLEVVFLFVLGIGLLLLEAFVIPGFGIAGILGIVAMFTGFYLSFPDLTSALTAIGFSVAGTVVGAFFILRRVPKSGLWKRLSLQTMLEDPGFTEDDPDEPVIVVGAVGRALTPLRPSGTVEIEGLRVDASSDGSFITAGSAVEIIRIYGRRVTVRERQ